MAALNLIAAVESFIVHAIDINVMKPYSSLSNRPNNLECLALTRLTSLENFCGKTRSLPLREALSIG
jgi:hypothetical protein